MSPGIGVKTAAVVCLALLLSRSALPQTTQQASSAPENSTAPQAQPAASADDQQGAMQQQQSVTAPTRRVPGARANLGGAVLGLVQSREGIPLGGVQVALQPMAAGNISSAETSADGIFRKRDLVPGKYQITFQLAGYEPLMQTGVTLRPGEVLTIEVRLKSTGAPAAAQTREVPARPGNSAQCGMR